MPFSISAFYFFYFASVGVYIIFLPKVLHDIGYSTFEIGLLFAIFPLMRFFTPFFFLKRIDLTHTVFINSTLISILLSFSFYYTIDSFWLFFINNIFLGVSLSLILPFVEAIAISVLQKERYGKIRLFGSIGFMIVALVLAKYLDDPSIAIDFYLVTVILTALFAIILSNSDKKSSPASTPSDEKFSLLKYWPFWVSMFLMQMSFGSFYNFYTIYETELGISLETTSYLWSFGVLCEIVMLYYQAPLLKNFDLMKLVKISILLTAIRWYLVYMYGDNLTIAYLAQSIHALSFGLYHSAMTMYLFSLYQNKKLAQQFLFGIAYGLGGFVGAIVAGKLYGEYLFLSSAFIALAALIVLYIKPKDNTIES
jgi:PPP family 3-phenylpropionic acid transporter